MTGSRGPRLSDAQRQRVQQARRVAAIDPEEMTGLGAGNEGAMYAIAYGRTKAALLALLDIIDALTGGAA